MVSVCRSAATAISAEGGTVRLENVAAIILNRMSTVVPKDLVTRLAQINGQPGIVSYRQGKPFSVLTLEIVNARIKAIYVVTNPQKLAHLHNLPAAPH